MDQKDVEIITRRLQQSKEITRARYVTALAEYVERFVEHGEAECFYLPYNLTLDELGSSLVIENLKGKQVVAQYLCNKVSGYTQRYNNPQKIHDPITVETMLSQVADMGMANDYPNDFYAGFAIKLDETTCAAFYMDQEEEVGVCGACHAAGYDNAYHGCGHNEPDTYTTKYWFLLCRSDQVGAIEWEEGLVR